jgi:hypothetical protein
MALQPMKFRKKVVLAKVETVEGEDAAPTGAANAIQISDVTITPVEAQMIQRGLVRPTLGSEGSIPVGVHSLLEFAVEFAGAGAAGTAPAWGVLMRGCGMAEEITVATKVDYLPASEDHESLTVHFNIDGNLHALRGARGSFDLDIESPGLPRLRFKFVGLWTDVAAAALPAVDFTAFKTATPVSNANTPDFTLHAHAAVMRRLRIELGGTPEHSDLVNVEDVQITDRQSKGSVVIRSPRVDVVNFFAAAKDAVTGALALTHGTAAGHIVEVACPVVQVMRPRYSDEKGIAMLEMELDIQPTDAGDDELKITVR